MLLASIVMIALAKCTPDMGLQPSSKDQNHHGGMMHMWAVASQQLQQQCHPECIHHEQWK